LVARGAQIVIDDGAATNLERKGDGVKSLVAIGLLTKALQESESAKNIILLIEEPESHLHPRAIHQLKDVLDTLQQDRQIILTTHCPLLVNRANVPSNIIVSKNVATPAKSLDTIRDILGVRASDNLRHAALVLVVEGTDDAISYRALLSHFSAELRSAFGSGALAFECLNGASKLRYTLSHLTSILCSYYAILDDDGEGRTALGEATAENLISNANVTLTKCRGLPESEFEDLLRPNIYARHFLTKYGVDLSMPHFGEKKKWSVRIAQGMTRSGKNWSNSEVAQDKLQIARMVEADPSDSILPERLPVIQTLVSSLEAYLRALR
jgi:hypothetical protein